jgi:predicted nucleotidyltransferase
VGGGGVLTERERDCMERYCALLRERLGDLLVEIRPFGSAARGDMWAAHWPMHSDIDLLVVTRGVIPEATQEQLINETYPLFLECGRQLSPQFRDAAASTR